MILPCEKFATYLISECVSAALSPVYSLISVYTVGYVPQSAGVTRASCASRRRASLVSLTICQDELVGFPRLRVYIVVYCMLRHTHQRQTTHQLHQNSAHRATRPSTEPGIKYADTHATKATRVHEGARPRSQLGSASPHSVAYRSTFLRLLSSLALTKVASFVAEWFSLDSRVPRR